MLASDLIPISIATLMPSSTVGLDLYQAEQDSDALVLYRGAEYPLAASDLVRLQQRGVTRLFIQKESQGRYQKYLRQLASAPTEDSTIPMVARLGAMDAVVRDVLTRSLSSNDSEKSVAAASQLGKVIAQTFTSSGFTTNDLFRVLQHDYTTFTHSANVAFYCATLAHRLGYSALDVEQITTGGLLHDLGKLEISEEILCKQSKLDEAEFREIKKHPLTGFRKLANRPELSFGQLMMVYQHHERLDGKGYPVGCEADEIHPWAKICTVVDVFEALTSQRPYRQPMPRQKALELQNRDGGTAFDPEILACWNSIIQNDLIP
jgi:putative nucleotidyltransferase with HDIG domain